MITRYSFFCYALIAVGQWWLYSIKLRTEGLFERVTQNTLEWTGSHLVLLAGALLIIPATRALKSYLKDKNRFLIYAATVLTVVGAVALIGQFIIDFYLISLFSDQSSTAAYAALDQIQSNSLIRFFCYDLITAWLVGQLLFLIALFSKKGYPKWAVGIFVLGLLMMVVGDQLHELLERSSYLLISVALFPAIKHKKS